ncbi:MAG: adenylylsulfate reductase, partial [Lachnospiraceae bacterium]|nr:adenylylsulfate reductase [Lachnospiraceae bacterium]
RCKDTIAPTGTIAQGVSARQTNSKGEVYETRYGLKTSERLYGTVVENREGRGPCYLDTTHISAEQEAELLKAYLNMAPSQTLKWLEAGVGPSKQPVEVEGTEPYIVGGHTASGYWIDQGRRTTIRGLYAAGDVAGGAPQKYVTGALAEGEIAAETILADRDRWLQQQRAEEHMQELSGAEGKQSGEQREPEWESLRAAAGDKAAEYSSYLEREPGLLTIEQLEMTMQKIMDQYAGGISADYRFNESGLEIAEQQITRLYRMLEMLSAEDMYDLLKIYEIRERLIVCQAVIAHLRARKETRWHSFAENADYPQKDDAWLKYINSRMADGRIETFARELVKRGAPALDFSQEVGS